MVVVHVTPGGTGSPTVYHLVDATQIRVETS